MSTWPIQQVRIDDIVFPGEDPPTALERLVRGSPGLSPIRDVVHVPAGLIDAAIEEIGPVVAGVLRTPLTDVFATGWRSYESLVSAARTTLEHPGEEQVVDLFDHRISWRHRPTIDVIVDGAPAGSIQVEIDIDVVLHAVRAVLSGGRLTKLRTGLADVEARFACAGVQASPVTRQVDLAQEIDLGTGIQLAGPPELPSFVPTAPGIPPF
jgi:hypothetical protein